MSFILDVNEADTTNKVFYSYDYYWIALPKKYLHKSLKFDGQTYTWDCKFFDTWIEIKFASSMSDALKWKEGDTFIFEELPNDWINIKKKF